MMPPPDMGPRPCASTGKAASANSTTAAAKAIEFARPFLLRTAFSFCCRFLLGRCAFSRCTGGDRFGLRARLRIYRQLTLHEQSHRPLNRNARYAGFFIDPAVAVELVLLIHQEVAKLAALIGLKHR